MTEQTSCQHADKYAAMENLPSGERMERDSEVIPVDSSDLKFRG